MTQQDGMQKFPMVIAAVCTVVMAVFGYGAWIGLAESLLPGLALVIGAIAVSAISPPAGLAAVMIALPTMHHLVPMPRGSFTLLELAILTSTVGVAINLLLNSVQRGWRNLTDVLTPAQIVVPAGLLLVATALSFLNLADESHRAESLREIRTVIVEPLMFMVAARMVFRRSQSRSWVVMVFILTGATVAGYGIYQLLTGSGGVDAGSVTRATALYSHPNNLAIYLERTLLLTLGVAVLRPRWYPVWLLAAVQFIGLVATFSRGALLGVLVGFAVVLLFVGAWKWLAGLLASGVAVIGAGLLLFPERLLDVGGDGAEPTRFAIWRSSVEMIKEYPVFGVGPDQFLYQYSRRFVEPMGWPERYTSHPHNIILDTWLRLGVVGLAAFALVAIGVVWMIQSQSVSLKSDAWSIGAIAALFGGFAHSMVDNGFFLPDLAVMSWLFVVILATVPALRPEAPVSTQPIVEPVPAAQPAYDEEWPTWQVEPGR